MKFPSRLRRELRRRAAAAGLSPETFQDPAARAGRTSGRKGDFAPPFNPAVARLLIGLAWFRTTQSFSFGQGPVAAVSRDGGRSWSAPVLVGADTAKWDQLGGAVGRKDPQTGASLIDVYATALSQVQQNLVGFYIKRYSFDLDALAWSGPSTVLQRTGGMLAVSAPRPFRSFDGSRRGLTWRESDTSARAFDSGGGTVQRDPAWEDTGFTIVQGGITYRGWQFAAAAPPPDVVVRSDSGLWPRNSSPWAVAPASFAGDWFNISTRVQDPSDGLLYPCTLRARAGGALAGTGFAGAQYEATYSGGASTEADPHGSFVNWGVFGSRAWEVDGAGPPTDFPLLTASLGPGDATLTLRVEHVYYAGLGGDGGLAGAPLGLFADVDFETLTPTQARFEDAGPVVAVGKKGDAATGYRWAGGAVSAFTFSEADADAQGLSVPPWRAALHRSALGSRGAFHALLGLQRRKRNFPGQPDLTDTISADGLPAGAAAPVEAQLMAADAALYASHRFAAGTDDVYALIGSSNGARWQAFFVGTDPLFGGFYDRPLDWVPR